MGEEDILLPDDVQPGDIIICHGIQQRVTYEFGAYALTKTEGTREIKDPRSDGTPAGESG